jgi:hypothetical protein
MWRWCQKSAASSPPRAETHHRQDFGKELTGNKVERAYGSPK